MEPCHGYSSKDKQKHKKKHWNISGQLFLFVERDFFPGEWTRIDNNNPENYEISEKNRKLFELKKIVEKQFLDLKTFNIKRIP